MTSHRFMSEYYTSHEGVVHVGSGTEYHLEAHPEITHELLEEAIGQLHFPDSEEWIEAEIDLGRIIGRAGVVATDPIGPYDKAQFAFRHGRSRPSHVVTGVVGEEVSTMVIIAKPRERGDGYQLVTAWIGRLSVLEPWNAYPGQELVDSLRHWSNHAMVYNPDTMGLPFDGTWNELLPEHRERRGGLRISTPEIAEILEKKIAEGLQPLYRQDTKQIRGKPGHSFTVATYVLELFVGRLELPEVLTYIPADGRRPEYYHCKIGLLDFHCRLDGSHLVKLPDEAGFGPNAYRFKVRGGRPVIVCAMRINVRRVTASTGTYVKYYLTLTAVNKSELVGSDTSRLRPEFDVIVNQVGEPGEDCQVFGPDEGCNCITLKRIGAKPKPRSLLERIDDVEVQAA